jgi:glycosyltransferase involved in cell wall biosynthesis
LTEKIKNVLFLEGYYGGSHRAFAEGWEKRSCHNIEIFKLPARKWKWRMQAGAWIFSEKIRNSELRIKPDIVFSTDMINLAEFLGLSKKIIGDIPSILYFHENQFSYPFRENNSTDFSWAAINVASALSAEILLFNSDYNRRNFFNSWKKGNRKMPDSHIADSRIRCIEKKSGVIPVGVDFDFFDKYKDQLNDQSSIPLVLWNHRWEHDKEPDVFFKILEQLKKRNIKFRLAVCGENFPDKPECFEKAEKYFRDEIIQFGYLPSREDYAKLLWNTDIIISTSSQEFLGLSVIEALWCGTYPLLPERLNYPDLLPGTQHEKHIYTSEKNLLDKLCNLLEAGKEKIKYPSHQKFLEQYSWPCVTDLLDKAVSDTS